MLSQWLQPNKRPKLQLREIKDKLCVCVRTCVFLQVHVHTCTYTCTYIHTHVHTHVCGDQRTALCVVSLPLFMFTPLFLFWGKISHRFGANLTVQWSACLDFISAGIQATTSEFWRQNFSDWVAWSALNKLIFEYVICLAGIWYCDFYFMFVFRISCMRTVFTSFLSSFPSYTSHPPDFLSNSWPLPL